MNDWTWHASVRLMGLFFIVTLLAGDVWAQDPVLTEKQPQAVKPVKEVAPVTQPGTRRGALPDLMSPNPTISLQATNSPEGPFAGDCNCCFQQGYMQMTTAMCYVRNVGNGPSIACKAKLTWKDRNNTPKAKVVDLPALEAGKQTFVNIPFAAAQTFSITDPVTLTIDHLNHVAESNENNNSVAFDFEHYRQTHLYQFQNCK